MLFDNTYIPSPELSAIDSDTDEMPNVPEQDMPADHVIFVIHGIGQQTEKYGYFYEHLNSLRETARQVLQAKVPNRDMRIELIPIEWHKHVHEQADPVLETITLKSMPTVRLINNEYLADVLFYFSRDRGQSIIDHCTHLFNSSYHNFMKKHPYFKGTISILGYSLGGIITWDILSHQRQPTNEVEKDELAKLNIHFPPLEFKPDYFFAIGSPLGGFLSVRNQHPNTYHPEEDIVFENIYHPFDPLAYRFEPLLNLYYKDQPAVVIDRSVPLGPGFMSSLTGNLLSSFFSWTSSSLGSENSLQESNDHGSFKEHTASSLPTASTTLSAGDNGDTGALNSGGGGGGGLFTAISSFVSSYFTISPTEDDDDDDDDQEALSRDSDHDSIIDPLSDPKDTTDELPRKFSLESCVSDTGSSNSSTSGEEDIPEELPLRWSRRRSRTLGPLDDIHFEPPHKEIHHGHHHWIEVLGIDGFELASSERASINFQRPPAKNDLWADLSQELTHPPVAEPVFESTVPDDPHEELNKLPGGRRIDYILQPESLMGMIANEYWNGIRAHFSYWTNKDLLWHIMTRLEQDL